MFHRATGMSVLAYRFHTVLLPGETRQGAQRTPTEGDRHIRHQWGYVDVRDAAEACRLGILAEGLGFEVLNIVAADALSERPTSELLDLHLPEVPRAKLLADSEGIWSIEKARALLGYKPVHGWRTQRP
jgi:nucleoside-diphosphate-sugar epimerase